MVDCVQCGAAAVVHAVWNTSGGVQSGDFCSVCMAEIERVFSPAVARGSLVFIYSSVEGTAHADF